VKTAIWEEQRASIRGTRSLAEGDDSGIPGAWALYWQRFANLCDRFAGACEDTQDAEKDCIHSSFEAGDELSVHQVSDRESDDPG